MTEQRLPQCSEIARTCDILMLTLRVLYEASNIAFQDVLDFDTIVWASIETP